MRMTQILWRCLLAAVFLHETSAEAAPSVWKHIPAMLAQNVQVTSHTLSEHTHSKTVVGSAPIDLFASSSVGSGCTGDADRCERPNKIAYGNILFNVEECSKEAAESALKYAIDTLGLNADEVKLQDAKVLQLDVTRDSVHPWTVMAYSYINGRSPFHFQVNLGLNVYLTFTTRAHRHRVVVQLNTLEHTYAVLEHTFVPTEAQKNVQPVLEPKIATYNVWNVNPPSIVYGEQNRWSMYNKRIDHLVNFINYIDADIVGLQEMRVDNTFGPVGMHTQMEHIRGRLNHDYQFVYRAAMSYINTNDPLEHIEEGPAILSKYPILSSDYVLLSRIVDDPNDSHQRLCLHAEVDVPHWGVIDVYVTHLSLSERSREQTMLEIWDFMQQGKGKTQVLLGDLNAEPQSRGIQFLQGLAPLQNTKTDLKDAWLELHEEPIPGSKDGYDVQHKFTFPSDDPIKRIDYILYRGQGQVDTCRVFGQAPTIDTVNNPKDNGMLSQDGLSPVYASDHRGVVATFKLQR